MSSPVRRSKLRLYRRALALTIPRSCPLIAISPRLWPLSQLPIGASTRGAVTNPALSILSGASPLPVLCPLYARANVIFVWVGHFCPTNHTFTTFAPVG